MVARQHNVDIPATPAGPRRPRGVRGIFFARRDRRAP